MKKKLRFTGALDYQKLQAMNEKDRNEWVRNDVETQMNHRVKEHMGDEKTHVYDKDTSYEIDATYDVIGQFYKKEGKLTATLTYRYGKYTTLKNIEYKNA